MSCGLGEEELFILYRLYTSRCFKPSSGFHSEKLKKAFKYKFKKDGKKFSRSVKKLLNERYMAAIKKKAPKYYIDEAGAKKALIMHGYHITHGKQRPL